MTSTGVHEVLSFWFGESPEQPRPELWFGKSDAVDAEIRERFAEQVDLAKRGELDAWCETPRGALAVVILLDQFARNIHRGSPRAYEADARAQRICLDAIARGHDTGLPPIQRAFLYMPLMHAEDHDLQERSIQAFRELAKQSSFGANALEHAEQHKAVVDRFGRYPHRNAVLGRETTPEEAAFLEDHPGW